MRIAFIWKPSAFTGRAPLREYWRTFLLFLVADYLLVAAYFLVALPFWHLPNPLDQPTPGLLGLLLVQAMFFATCLSPVSARRLQDLGLSAKPILWMCRHLLPFALILTAAGILCQLAGSPAIATGAWSVGLALCVPLHAALSLSAMMAIFGSQTGPNGYGPNPRHVSI